MTSTTKWEKELKKWRYNSKELRLEKEVPAYDEDEKYMGHVWCAVVTEDVKDLLTKQSKKIVEVVNSHNRPGHFVINAVVKGIIKDLDNLLQGEV